MLAQRTRTMLMSFRKLSALSLGSCLALTLVANAVGQNYHYDDAGRLMRVAYLEGGGVAYTYDESDNMTSAMPLDLLPAPQIEEVTRLSPTEARITWQEQPGATGYAIERRRVDSTVWERIATVNSDATSFVDSTLDPGEDYVYRIAAINEDGDSAFSREAAFQAVPTPAISEGGIVNGATFLEEQLLAPGSIVTVFGPDIGLEVTEEGLAPFNASANSIPLPTELGGYSLLINGDEVPLFFVGGREVQALEGEKDAKGAPTFVGQINAQVPWETVIGGPVDVVVRRQSPGGALDSDPSMIQLAPASPGIFEFPAGQAIVTNFSLGNDDVITGTWAQPENSVPNVPTQPAPVGGVIIIWCMGLGPVLPPVETGDIPDAGAALSETVRPIRVFIGGVEAEIFGKPVLQATNVALYQINARVPMIEPGDAVPILIEVEKEDGSDLLSKSDVTIAVRAASQDP